MKRKLEKYRQREWATMSDEVLLEEIKTYRVSHLQILTRGSIIVHVTIQSIGSLL